MVHPNLLFDPKTAPILTPKLLLAESVKRQIAEIVFPDFLPITLTLIWR
jgi:hypothetical protein